jgi:hypothetical protein
LHVLSLHLLFRRPQVRRVNAMSCGDLMGV